ncbi:MAG: PKD domain-containing protein [Bacteroidia bacterium]|nr:PKD domain-containing protein [Bacteroidia bacterium]
MRRRLSLLLTMLLLTGSHTVYSQCMTYPVSFQERVLSSSAIVEGKIISQQSYWNTNQDFIYTSHVIDVYKVFKGNISGTQIEIITEGGIVGGTKITAEPNLELQTNDIGTFFLNNPVQANALSPFYPAKQFSAYALHQGFIRYDLKSQSGIDPFGTYQNIPADVYLQIEIILNRPYEDVILFDITSPQSGAQYKMMVPPVISAITPGTSTAGTFSLVTITGNNFGNGPFGGTRNLEWRDANNGGAGFVSTPANHIVLWSNTSIQAWVPTQAGSGTIRVTNDLNESTVSAIAITINYNETNVVSGGVYYQPDLVNRNGTGGYIYTYNTTFNGNAPAVAAFERALQTWRCGTFVNFYRTGTIATACQALDGTNLVTFDGSCALPAGVLGISYSYYAACAAGVWYLNENDLKFRTNGTGGINWNYGPAATTGGLFDFESVAVHELGHSHQLGHTILPVTVMNYAIGPNTDRRTLTPASETAGGLDIMTRSVINNPCGPTAMIALTAANCAIAAPVANFSGTPLTGCNTLTVTFTDLSTNTPTSWNWSFPGGVPATFNGQNPPPIFYGVPGTYSVTLTVTNGFGSDTHTKTNYVTVNNCPPPVADFYGNPTTLCEGQQVYFYDLSTNSPTSWSWSFPGGTPATSAAQNPVITYNTAGVYNVTLTATNPYGNNTVTKTSYITVNACPPPPTANFTGSPTTLCAGASVTFTDLSTGSPTSWNWSFPGGTPLTSIAQNPVVTYNTPGVYSVTLTVTNASGSASFTRTNYITVNVCSAPTANFAGNPLLVCAGQTVSFVDLSTQSPTSWSWTFPGGTPGTSTAQNPVITYNTPGVYNVTLTATNGFGNNTHTKTNYVNVVTCPPVGSGLIVNDGGYIFIQPGVTVTVQGGVINQDNGPFIGEWDNRGTVTLTGDWTNNSTGFAFINLTAGTFEMLGANQLITGTTTTNFFNLTLSGTGIKRQTVDARTYGILALNDRELATDANIMYVMNPAVGAITRTGALNSTPVQGFVSSTGNGRLYRTTNSASFYLFPVGSSLTTPRFRPVELRPNTSATGAFAVRFVNNDANLDGLNRAIKDPTLGVINPYWYQKISRISGGMNTDVRLYVDDVQDNVTSFPTLQMTEWGYNIPPIQWRHITGNSAIAAASPVLGSVTKAGWNIFDTENFNIAPESVPLPVELLEFSANCKSDKVEIEWSTASETNCDYFSVEKSFDGILFSEFARVQGVGNSSQLQNYSVADKALIEQKVFYRLVQFDFNGRSHKFTPAVAYCRKNNQGVQVINVYPTPFAGEVYIEFTSAESETVTFDLIDAAGRKVAEKIYEAGAGFNRIVWNLESFATGFYQLDVSAASSSVRFKLVKSH